MTDNNNARYWIIVHSYDGAEESDIEDLVSQTYEYNSMFAACNEIVYECCIYDMVESSRRNMETAV